MILPSLAFLWPFLLIAAAGWFIEWLIDAKLTLLVSVPDALPHGSCRQRVEGGDQAPGVLARRPALHLVQLEEAARGALPPLHRAAGARLRLAGYRGILQGPPRLFRGPRVARGDHGGRERHQADPLLHGLPRLRQVDDAEGVVARPAAVPGLQQQAADHRAPESPQPCLLVPLGRFRQWRNIYLICEPCRRKLEAERGHPLHKRYYTGSFITDSRSSGLNSRSRLASIQLSLTVLISG